MKIILASNSPRRIELLKKITDDFIIIPPDINEDIGKNSLVLPLFLSLLKAENVLQKETGIIIAADTMVSLGNRIFGKPENFAGAIDTLKILSGKTHTVLTGVCIAYCSTRILTLEKTLVQFNELTTEQIEEYIEKFKPFDKAGSYGIQDDFPLIRSISGDYHNVVGFPVNSIKKLLNEILNIHTKKGV